MTFEAFLEQTRFPSMAKEHLPWVLSEKIQIELLKRPDAETLINEAIDEINKGSTKSVEALIKKRLELE